MESTSLVSTVVKVFSVHLSYTHKQHSYKLLGYLVYRNHFKQHS